MDILNISVEWWIWVIIGLVLLMLEIFDGSLLLSGLGVAAILVGAIEYISDMSLNYQLLLWGAFDVIYFFIWIKFIKSEKESIAEEAYDVIGVAKTDIKPHQEGRVKFDTKFLGGLEWIAISDYEINEGTLVTVDKVIQQKVKVKPVNKGE